MGPLLLLPSVWVLLEWVRGWFLSGFPWLSLGYSQLQAPLAGLAIVVPFLLRGDASASRVFEAYDAESGAGLGVSEHPVTAAVV